MGISIVGGKVEKPIYYALHTTVVWCNNESGSWEHFQKGLLSEAYWLSDFGFCNMRKDDDPILFDITQMKAYSDYQPDDNDLCAICHTGEVLVSKQVVREVGMYNKSSEQWIVGARSYAIEPLDTWVKIG